jgi:hypothetical protein
MSSRSLLVSLKSCATYRAGSLIKVGRFCPHLLVLDVRMPGLDEVLAVYFSTIPFGEAGLRVSFVRHRFDLDDAGQWRSRRRVCRN